MLRIKLQYPIDENKIDCETNIKVFTVVNKCEAKHLIGEKVAIYNRDKECWSEFDDVGFTYKLYGVSNSFQIMSQGFDGIINRDIIGEIPKEPERKFNTLELFMPDNYCRINGCFDCTFISCNDCLYDKRGNYEIYKKCLLSEFEDFKIISVVEYNDCVECD